MAAANSEVVWDAANSRFATRDGLAYLQYTMLSRNQKSLMDMIHTYVPPSKRGSGIAALLCAAAFQHAQQHGLLVIPTCSYISILAFWMLSFMRRFLLLEGSFPFPDGGLPRGGCQRFVVLIM
ncbi:hypothetical protein L7F22_038588 [Adiantum nelumboides]|nr:hypothetical protein [Adiantum nelumboides]